MIFMLDKLLLAYARHFPVRAGKYRIVERLWRFGINKNDTYRTSTLKYGNFTMECDLRKMLQRQFYFFGTYFLEEPVLDKWREQACTAKIIFDIGANAGIYSFAAASCNPISQIFAFEPTPDILNHLKSTVNENHLQDRIHVHSTAISSTSGTAILNFFTGENYDNEGMNFVSTSAKDDKSIQVNTSTLDDFCIKYGLQNIDMIKIDVQGYEPEVLEGAEQLLSRKAINMIFFELNWNTVDKSRCSATRSVKILHEAGFKFSDPKNKCEAKVAGPWMFGLTDIVAILNR
jgi:FkbM family methyltransferase